MADSLEGVLARIPGYGGYLAKRQYDENQQLGQLQQAHGVMGIVSQMEAAKQQAKMREAMAQSGGDPEKALEIALKSGNVAAAHQLAPLVKMKQDQRLREDTVRGMRDLNAPPPAAVPQDLKLMPTGTEPAAPPAPANPRQERIAYLTKLSQMPAYATNPVVMQRIQAEIDKLSSIKPMVEHNFSIGKDMVQPHISHDEGRTWQPIPGSQPSAKFAKQVAPAVNINAPSKEELSKDAVRDLAVQSLYDSNVLAGYRRDTTAMSRIANERLKVMREAGVTSEDVVSGRAGFKADTASLNKLTPQYDAVTAFEKTAIRNGKILMDLADKVDTTGAPVIDTWIRKGRQATGDPDVAKFNAQLHLYRAEAARILTQPNLSGVLSDSARHEMEDFMKGGSSAKQIRDVVNLLERDFDNRKQTLEEQIGSIRTRMRGRVAPGPAADPGSPAPAPAAAPKVVDFGSLK